MTVPERKPPASMVMTRIGGVDYPVKSVPFCHTCQSPHRLQIESMLIQGYSYTAISASLEGKEEGRFPHPSPEAISSHYRLSHMPIQAAAQRRLIEQQAVRIGRDIESSMDSLVDYVTINQMILHKGFEALQAGTLIPEMGDVLAAIRNQHTIDQSMEGGADTQTWAEAVMVMMEEARKKMSPADWQDYGNSLKGNPILRAMAAKQNAIDAGDNPDSQESM